MFRNTCISSSFLLSRCRRFALQKELRVFLFAFLTHTVEQIALYCLFIFHHHFLPKMTLIIGSFSSSFFVASKNSKQESSLLSPCGQFQIDHSGLTRDCLIFFIISKVQDKTTPCWNIPALVVNQSTLSRNLRVIVKTDCADGLTPVSAAVTEVDVSHSFIWMKCTDLMIQ